MKKRFSVEGTYSIKDNEEKDFRIEYDNSVENEENNSKLLRLLNHPWRLIKEGGKLGVNGVKLFFTVMFLFSVSNIVLFIYALGRLFSTDFAFSKIALTFFVFIIGLGITIYAVYRTYQFVVIDTVRVIYDNLASFFHRISELVIDKVEDLFQGKVDLSESQLKNTLDFGKMVHSKYQNTPRFLRKGIVLILKRIPFVGMLMDLQEEIASGKKLEASAKLYNKMDGFITETIFGNNNTNWIWWLLPLNILMWIFLIQFKIG